MTPAPTGQDPWPHAARTVEQHAAAVLGLLDGITLDARFVPLEQAGGRVLAEDVVAGVQLPPFANAQMDGYAVRADELRDAHDDGEPTLPLTGAVPAGAAPPPLPAGTAAPIMTGAMIPAGADAVVPVEETDPARFPDWLTDADPQPPAGARVRFTAGAAATEPGRFVRPAGSDLARGAVALTAGTRVTPAAAGVLAALGRADVAVRRPLRVLLYSTGSEVVEPGLPLRPGQIHDANSAILRAALNACGTEVVTARLVADAPAALLSALDADVRDAAPDLVLSSGGISRGAFEVVKQSLGGRGVAFWSVAMQPGGPQGAGLLDVGGSRVPFLGFPGNPVSTLVSVEMFLRPALAARFGAPARPRFRAALAEPVTPLAGKQQIRRGTLTATAGGPVVRLVGGPSSHLLHAAATADVLVHLPVTAEPLGVGTPVTVTPLD
ncbi:molybdopterin molybdenumtransferase [Tersicoccus solisilvae]|uniref:Molybdopterin molybdenumtransferase n=1 Tax=Tersicoccus solisilvae TaxID=1882339 RepID=A0ABQ1NN08_9MICC|nr:gephyrin-like molybdotransferase Glp [Tersicoccus solisilvae]GGC78364.1 molybdopterin molybdenumtransferase [Tersicoccus solisilvae]